ncbi:ABC transporter permease [Mycoplasma phocoenae]|uniref:ABC transporter permease n=1 Tax=Mycoplasma phocoenae TaxID=754517 RepID=A0A858U6B6_9MOLU|nr:ABC transporter permease [Mycoplasma phocoenae]QJG66773.1 ABC transporter permease [Mycoplasma phocoenae]
MANSNKKRRQESPNNVHGNNLAPNALLQPFQHRKWEIIGNIFEYNETRGMRKRKGAFSDFFYRFSRSFSGVFGLITLLVIIALALVLPLFSADPNKLNISERYHTFFTEGNIFGTDSLGRDIWARLWWGLRYSLTLAVVTSLIQVFFGLLIGVMMGHFKWFDKIMTFIIKVITNVPSIIILIIITIVFKPTFWVIVFALTFTSWTGIANQMRSQVMRAKTFEWVSASKVLGTPTYKVLLNYIPVVIPLLITEIVFNVPGVIGAETSLAFIGLSIIDTPTLGNLINDGTTIFLTYPRYVLLPSSILIIVTTSIQLMASAVQDSLLRQR